jgi:hypothetical protein
VGDAGVAADDGAGARHECGESRERQAAGVDVTGGHVRAPGERGHQFLLPRPAGDDDP